MAFSVLRPVFQKRAAGIFISCSRSSQDGAAGCCNSGAKTLKLGGHRNMSTNGSGESPPWLMLPPAGDMVYKYYSLAEKRVLSIRQESESESESESEMVGSSHGWVALFNRRNNDLFLSNPLSRRHIKLPRIEILRDPEVNLRDGHASVSKVILSSSPDEEGCRAVMTYAPASMGGSRLAFCSPRRSWRWTPIGDMYLNHQRYAIDRQIRYNFERVCEDMVYCRRRKILTCMTPCEFDLECLKQYYKCEIANWDIGNPLMDDWNMGNPQIEDWDLDIGNPPLKVWEIQKEVSLRKAEKAYENEKGNTRCWVVENMGLLQEQCVQIPHLVYAEQSDQLYLVMRFVALIGPDGSRLDRVPLCPVRGLGGHYPCQTVGFVVLKVYTNRVYEVVDGLDGLAMFVGTNHSLAISASDFPELKPNSIYFTDAKRLRMLDGVNDTGIFDYENKTICPIIDDPIKSSSSMWWF